MLVGDALIAKMSELRYGIPLSSVEVSAFKHLLWMTNVYRELSMLHMEALAKLKRSTPHLEFPALHKELFSVDS